MPLLQWKDEWSLPNHRECRGDNTTTMLAET
jgi:hypothetical protein